MAAPIASTCKRKTHARPARPRRGSICSTPGARRPHYSPAERAALAWAEALTNVSTTHAPDADYQALRAHFTEKEIVDLTYLIGMINFWNRLAIGMRYVPEAAASA